MAKTYFLFKVVSWYFDQIGLLLKHFGFVFISEVDQENVNFWGGYFENITFQLKGGVATFWATFGKMGCFLFQHLVPLMTAKSLHILS